MKYLLCWIAVFLLMASVSAAVLNHFGQPGWFALLIGAFFGFWAAGHRGK